MECETDRLTGAAAAVMQVLYWTFVMKRELSPKTKPSIFQSIYIPAPTYGREF